MRIVVIGSKGQLGAELCRQLAAGIEPARAGPAGAPTSAAVSPAAAFEELVGLDLPEFDLTDRQRVVGTLLGLRPDVLINTAAYTLVDRAEQQPEACRRVNVDGVAHLVEACRLLDCMLIQISTDYVFGRDLRRRRPYQETDQPGPLGIYGQTKLEAERLVAEWPRHFIVRTCGLYGRLGPCSAGNFVDTMLRLAERGCRLRVVNDQHCTPSYTVHVARAIRFLLGTAAYGTYHVVNSGQTTWYEFALELFRQLGTGVQVEPISTAEYGALAPRPGYSVLDTAKYHALAGCPVMPPWHEALAEYLAACQQRPSGA